MEECLLANAGAKYRLRGTVLGWWLWKEKNSQFKLEQQLPVPLQDMA